MGGSAFAVGDNPLHTPRMSPSVYRAVRERCSHILRQVFVIVATPIEAPAKKDFGDIDIFLAWERDEIFPCSAPAMPSPSYDETSQKGTGDGGNNVRSKGSSSSSNSDALLEKAIRLLGAVRSKQEQPGVASVAIPWPEDLLPAAAAADSNDSDSDSDKKNRPSPPRLHIQVDLHVCSSLPDLQWMLFKHTHGDLWNMLGSTIRPFGLTVNEAGLWVRVPEIEACDRNRARVLATRDPGETLRFLGLAQAARQWEQPFASADALFEYAATCRLFWVRPAEDADADADAVDITTTTTGDRRTLKANDRRRMRQRPMFRAWVDEFLPRCRASGRFSATTTTTREQVRDEAFARFPGLRCAYAARLREWRVERQRLHLWRDVIKAALPPASADNSQTKTDTSGISVHYRGVAAAALKKLILSGDDDAGDLDLDLDRSVVQEARAKLKNPDGTFDEDAVRAWVRAHWREVGDAAWAASQRRYAEKVAARKEKEKEKGQGQGGEGDKGESKGGGVRGS
ncbi:hypothetical protein F5X96DRAFT_695642 [Biscogniauxia mediterranea]|nr:hypothetical protein F5X96DRAFT_695642 [Biscogniauxia mediterranea]